MPESGFKPIPPVTVICVPKKFGSHGYGAKCDGDLLFIPYNKLIDESFACVPEKKTIVLLRSHFNALPDYNEVCL